MAFALFSHPSRNVFQLAMIHCVFSLHFLVLVKFCAHILPNNIFDQFLIRLHSNCIVWTDLKHRCNDRVSAGKSKGVSTEPETLSFVQVLSVQSRIISLCTSGPPSESIGT